jgi:hypothetical protein
MALKKSMAFEAVEHTFVHGSQLKTEAKTITLVDCLMRVTSVKGGKGLVSFSLEIASDGVTFVRDYEFPPDMSGPNFIKQAYEHLKTLPEFEGAVDC